LKLSRSDSIYDHAPSRCLWDSAATAPRLGLPSRVARARLPAVAGRAPPSHASPPRLAAGSTVRAARAPNRWSGGRFVPP